MTDLESPPTLLLRHWAKYSRYCILLNPVRIVGASPTNSASVEKIMTARYWTLLSLSLFIKRLRQNKNKAKIKQMFNLQPQFRRLRCLSC